MLLNNIEDLETGLCHLADCLFSQGEMNNLEHTKIAKVIGDYGKSKGLRSFDYIWPDGKSEPRIQWLKEEIGKEDNNDR